MIVRIGRVLSATRKCDSVAFTMREIRLWVWTHRINLSSLRYFARYWFGFFDGRKKICVARYGKWGLLLVRVKDSEHGRSRIIVI